MPRVNGLLGLRRVAAAATYPAPLAARLAKPVLTANQVSARAVPALAGIASAGP